MAGARKINELTPLQAEARAAFYNFNKAPSRANMTPLLKQCERLSYAFVYGVEALSQRDAEQAPATEQAPAVTQEAGEADTAAVVEQSPAETQARRVRRIGGSSEQTVAVA